MWFAEASLTRLAAFRILILSLALMDFFVYAGTVFVDARAVSAGGVTPAWNPIYLFEVLHLQPIDYQTACWVFAVALAATTLGILGLFTRTACLLVALCSLYWTGMVYSFGKAHHDKVVLAFTLMMLPLAPVGARLSLDAVLERYRRVKRGLSPLQMPERSELAALPIRVAQITAAFGYFFAGATKIATSGFEWANGYTLIGHMMGHNNTWSNFFSQNVALCQVMGVFTLLLQATFPLIFVFPKLRWFYLPGVVAFHISTWQTMDTGPYMSLWFTLICFLPLERIPGWLVAAPLWRLPMLALPTALVLYVFSMFVPWWMVFFLLPPLAALLIMLLPRTQLTVLYDGGCGFCRRSLAVLKALDWTNNMDCHDLQDRAQVQERFGDLDEAELRRDMHSVDQTGVIRKGFATYQSLAWRLPLMAPFAWLLYLPPISILGKSIYRRVADSRLRDDCGEAGCQIHRSKPGT